MEKSIESIWKKGFLNPSDMVVPKLNNLYEQKSQSIVEKLKRMFVLNFYYIIGLAVFIFLLSLIGKVALIGTPVSLMMLYLAYYGKQQNDKMKTIDQTNSSYDYLISFNSWRIEAIKGYGKIYRFFYPLFFIALMLGMWHSPVFNKIIRHSIANHPHWELIWGVPQYLLIGSAIFIVFTVLFSGKIYQFDLYLVYGRAFKKLDNLIQDMEELRK